MTDCEQRIDLDWGRSRSCGQEAAGEFNGRHFCKSHLGIAKGAAKRAAAISAKYAQQNALAAELRQIRDSLHLPGDSTTRYSHGADAPLYLIISEQELRHFAKENKV